MSRNDKGQFAKGTMIKDITGKRFGKLIVIGLDNIVNNRAYWNVRCDCGNEKSVRGDTLKVIVSCGCVKKEQDKINLGIKYNHEMTHHEAYNIWVNMMRRCHSEKDKFFSCYGGRGIDVCEEWQDVKKFCKWADESGFQKGLSIERKDVNGNYCPDNCCWIPKNEQSKNRRTSIIIKYNGEDRLLCEVARELGLNYQTVRSRWKIGIRDNERLLYNGNLKEFQNGNKR